jgi:superfamily I DNA/RNA helicase
MQLTNEQKDIIDYTVHEGGMLLVPAGAGCGKTFISQEVVKKLNPANGLYTAFNKAIVTESEEKFSDFNITCKTLHALAYKYVKPKRNGVQELSYNGIKEDLTYPEKALVLENINLFFVSDSIDMWEFFDLEFSDEKAYLKKYAIKYVNLMLQKKIPMSFNFMLKYFHILLSEGRDCKYDIVILDEINDTTAVALEIFKLIDSPIKLGLGESNQAIYHFLNLKDGFVELDKAKTLPLTNSFRCSTSIAASIQKFMRSWVTETFTFVGTETPVSNGNTLYVTMTNAAIIYIIKEFLTINKRFTLLRKISEIFAYPLAIVSASSGNTVYQHKYKFLEKEYLSYIKTSCHKMTFFSYLKEVVNDQDTKSAVNLIMSLKTSGTNIFDLYAKAKAVKPDPKYTISTVFTSKGLEFETVYINSDMNNRISKIIEKGGIHSEEDLVAFRCYYVACSRAGTNLYGASHLDYYQK